MKRSEEPQPSDTRRSREAGSVAGGGQPAREAVEGGRLRRIWWWAASVTAVGGAFVAAFCLWVMSTPLTLRVAAQARTGAAAAAGIALLSAGALAVLWRRRQRASVGGGRRGRHAVVTLIVCGVLAGGVAAMRHFRWELRFAGVTSLHELPVDTSGYTIERLDFGFSASFARGDSLYFADSAGVVYRTSGAAGGEQPVRLGSAGVAPKMLFVSTEGTLFLSALGQGMLRSADAGRTWTQCLSDPVWRMDEDRASGDLYAGNYERRRSPPKGAALHHSRDGGATWRTVYRDEGLDHIHTVRCDSEHGRLYIATGDGPARGQLFSDDGGETWRRIIVGRKEGHTDAAIGRSGVLWGSDDRLGRVMRSPREDVTAGEVALWCKGQQVWWVVAEDRGVFAGTYVEDADKTAPAYLAASHDGGETWQKLLEFAPGRPGPKGLIGESRYLTTDGWLYFSTTDGEGYRVRNSSSPPS